MHRIFVQILQQFRIDDSDLGDDDRWIIVSLKTYGIQYFCLIIHMTRD